MSTVRQRLCRCVHVCLPVQRDEPGEDARRARWYRTAARLEVDRTPCAGITQIRFEGLRASPALSALCAPLSDVKLSRRR